MARTGAQAIKFQTHIAEEESSPDEPWRVKFSPQDTTRYDYWKRIEFTEEQWRGLALHATECGLHFLSSAFSLAAVDLLERTGVPAWKVGAGEIGNLPMLERMSKTGKPVMLSSGMASWGDMDRAVDCVRRTGAPVAVFQCTSEYPCPPERTGLNVLAELEKRYSCPVGLSDHSGAIYAGLAAATLGARFLEVHVCLSRENFGPDVSSSLTTTELKQLVDGVKFVETALLHPVDKDVQVLRVEGSTQDLREELSGGTRPQPRYTLGGSRLCRQKASHRHRCITPSGLRGSTSEVARSLSIIGLRNRLGYH